MKTLFISHSSQVGGATRSIMYGIKNCDKYLLLVPNEGPILPLYDDEKIKYEIVHIPALFYSQYSKITLRAIISFLYRLPNIFKLIRYINQGYTIIEFNEIVFAPTAYLLKLFYKDKIKIILHARVTMPIYRFGWSKYFFHYFLKKADHIIAIGQTEFDDLPKNCSKSILINPVDFGRYTPTFNKSNYLHDRYGIPKGSVIAAIFGQLHIGKGQDFIVHALTQTTIPNNVFFIFFGNGNEKYIEQLKYMTSKFFLKDKIIFAGYVNNVYECMEGCDFIIRSEDFGLLGRDIMEANSLGIPILTSIDNTKDYSMLIKEEHNALTFVPKNMLSFINQLNNMLILHSKMRGWAHKDQFGYTNSEYYCNNLKKIWRKLR